jgi:hypothetical protein
MKTADEVLGVLVHVHFSALPNSLSPNKTEPEQVAEHWFGNLILTLPKKQKPD